MLLTPAFVSLDYRALPFRYCSFLPLWCYSLQALTISQVTCSDYTHRRFVQNLSQTGHAPTKPACTTSSTHGLHRCEKGHSLAFRERGRRRADKKRAVHVFYSLLNAPLAARAAGDLQPTD